MVLTPLLPAGAQETTPRAALAELQGVCGSASIGLDGQLQLDVDAGMAQRRTETVTSGGQQVVVGESLVEATAPVATTIAYLDDVFFGPTWTGSLPFTYTIHTEVLVDGAAVWWQTVDAACTVAGGEPTFTYDEGVVPAPAPAPQPTTPGPSGPVVTPRFTG
ncbi:hypothetical protein [Rhabdothermincola salaria]|uniref:hypothetical protein n=1 Tax=Rhabdothermincola salaria TaxID=2903142 RepID=UPI001E552C04|nr:hypothetical protein [Rhabdothermincola salaria]MCD9625223.1 hypothetical protein [Rhabdothermincola salaria]